jgi:hypothetical protein
LQKIAIFAKIGVFAKIGLFAKIGVFAKIGFCKNRKKSFLRNPKFVQVFFAVIIRKIRFSRFSPGNFAKIRSDFCENRVFLPEIRFSQKIFSKHFRNVCRTIPMGWGVRIPFFSKIGNLRNFSLYTAKIVFFGHTA